jgi:hypothetical protein|tara:strand:- start:546 stop:740 length:195 start_codon:yes stop_codon:yes gene_type:complete
MIHNIAEATRAQITSEIDLMSNQEVAICLDIKPGAGWDSWDEMFACADWDYLRNRLINETFGAQ